MNVRRATNELLDFAAEISSERSLLEALTYWLSEHQVSEFWDDYKRENDLEEMGY